MSLRDEESGYSEYSDDQYEAARKAAIDARICDPSACADAFVQHDDTVFMNLAWKMQECAEAVTEFTRAAATVKLQKDVQQWLDDSHDALTEVSEEEIHRAADMLFGDD